MRRMAWLGAAWILALQPACTEERTPQALPRFIAHAPTQPRLALVLGSGGPRGFAHVGVVKVLEAAGIKPDLIVGSSAGALMGSLLAAGYDAASVERMALDLSLQDLFDFGYITDRKLRGTALEAWVNRSLGDRPIEALQTSLVVVATQRDTRQLVRFNAGDAGRAVRASSAIPAQFQPVPIGDLEYQDGDLSSPVPIRVAREAGARVVVAVDVSQNVERAPPPDWAPAQWTSEAVERRQRIRAEAPLADVIIEPPLPYLVRFDGDYRRMAIARGEAAARTALPAIRRALGLTDERPTADGATVHSQP